MVIVMSIIFKLSLRTELSLEQRKSLLAVGKLVQMMANEVSKPNFSHHTSTLICNFTIRT